MCFCVLRSFWQWNTTRSYSQFSSKNSQYFGADNLPCEIWDNLPQRHFFTCNRLTATMFDIFMLLTSPRIRSKDTFQDNTTVWKKAQKRKSFYKNPILIAAIVPWIITLFMVCKRRASSALTFDDAACFYLETSRRIFVQQKESVYSELFFRPFDVVV